MRQTHAYEGPCSKPGQLRYRAALVALVLACLTLLACGDSSSRPDATRTLAAAGDRADLNLPDGEGIARFIVDRFNQGFIGCNYEKAASGLRQLAGLFEASAQSGLLGEYSDDVYSGPPDPDSSAYSPYNPPPDRQTELHNLLSMFPKGRFAARRVPGDGILDWPFSTDEPEATAIEALDGLPFAELCHAVVGYLSRGQGPATLRASYRRAGTDQHGLPQWALAFPRGSAPSHSLAIDAIRSLTVRQSQAGWKIVSFRPAS